MRPFDVTAPGSLKRADGERRLRDEQRRGHAVGRCRSGDATRTSSSEATVRPPIFADST